MRILILDDDIDFAKRLQKRLFNLFSEYEDDNVFEICTSFIARADMETYDFAFVDIDLKEYDGIDVAQELRQRGLCRNLVFVTAHANLVFDSLVVQPFYFIRKIFFEEDFEVFKSLVKTLLVEKTEQSLVIKYRNSIKKVLVEDIVALEGNNHETIIHGLNETNHCNQQLKELFAELDHNIFFQVHRSFIINLNYVKQLTPTVAYMVNGEEIPIARNRKNSLYETYEEFLIS